MIKISSSLLTADFGYMAETVKMLDKAGTDWIHCDIMDNVFVPNMSFGQPMIKSLRKVTNKTLDVHLMMYNPYPYIEEFADCGADNITVHIESMVNVHIHRILNKIRQCGKKAGICLNPSTSHIVLEYLYDMVDLILIMSVNPGYGGQKFIPSTLKKIENIANDKIKLNLSYEIAVDGGINLTNYRDIINAGATVLVVGNTIISSKNPAETIRILKTGAKV